MGRWASDKQTLTSDPRCIAVRPVGHVIDPLRDPEKNGHEILTMHGVAPFDHIAWGLPGATVTLALPDEEAFATTPLHELLRAAYALNPEATALVGRLSYAEMLRLAGNAAHAIAARVPPGAPAACILPRTPVATAGLLGYLVSGRLRFALEPSNPAKRQAALLEDS